MSDNILIIVILGIVLGIFVLVLVLGFLWVTKHRKALRSGWQAAQEGRLADAQRTFKELAYNNLGAFIGLGKEPFNEALRGLAEVYEKAGVTVDLEEIRLIRRAISALEKGNSGGVGEKLTSGGKIGDFARGIASGWKIENYVEEGRKLITALPDLNPPEGT